MVRSWTLAWSRVTGGGAAFGFLLADLEADLGMVAAARGVGAQCAVCSAAGLRDGPNDGWCASRLPALREPDASGYGPFTDARETPARA